MFTTLMAFNDLCGNQLLSEIPSPDQAYKIAVFQRDCGATTGFTTQVSLLKAEEILPNESGNLFGADTNRGKSPIGAGGGPEVKIFWVGLRTIRLSHHKDTRVLWSKTQISEVSAIYDFFN